MFIETQSKLAKLFYKQEWLLKHGYVLRISLTAALAGFIFGFDTVVISGANLPIKELWHTSPCFMDFLSCRWHYGERL